MNSKKGEVEIGVLRIEKASVFLRTLTVPLIDAISEFKAGVFRAVNHPAPAVTSPLGVCPQVRPAQKIGPCVYLNFPPPLRFFLPIWRAPFSTRRSSDDPEEGEAGEAGAWAQRRAVLPPQHARPDLHM